MTEDELEAISIRADEGAHGSDLDRALDQDVPALIAEVRRLRALVADAENANAHDECPWCKPTPVSPFHAPECPAFSGRGVVR